MNSRTLEMLLKLRKYELEKQQWKLHELHLAEHQCRDSVNHSMAVIRKVSRMFERPTNPVEAVQGAEYLSEATAIHESALRELAQARVDSNTQLAATLKSQQRKEMIQRLLDHTLEQERMEEDYQERLFLDDMAQAKFVRQEEAAVL